LTSYQQDGFVTAYYWSHAIIARDWFRFAQHVEQQKQVSKTFLIYNRAWAGTREYRLCFAEQIVKNGLTHHCQMSFNAVDNQHYTQHQFINADFQISNFELEDFSAFYFGLIRF
jgi:hypothetical protein